MTADETTGPARAEPGPLRQVAAALAISLLLVGGANALGLLARLSELALRRFSAWWPPRSLELAPLGVTGLLILATAYALATRGSRMRSPGLAGHRRFLPPLDLLLLQLGNITFMAFALILAVVTFGLLSSALRALVAGPWLAARGLAVCVGLGGAAALLALRGARAGRSPGRVLQRRWAKRAAILGVAAGVFWWIDRASAWSLLRLRCADGQVDATTLASLYALLWLLLGGSATVTRLTRPASDAPESTSRRAGLVAGSLLAWLAYLGFLGLFLYGALLTLRGHLA